MDLSGLGLGPVVGPCEYGSKLLGFLNQHDCQLLRNDSAAESWTLHLIPILSMRYTACLSQHLE